MSGSLFSVEGVELSYKSKILAGILAKRAFVGPYLAVIGGQHSCNYRCVFCEWFSPMIKKSNDETLNPDCCINMDVYKRLVRELSALGTKIILINYFEPFMDSQLIEKIKFAKQCNLKCMIITNGSLINEENAEQIVDLKLDYLNVSINAGTSETYPRIHTTETEETFERITSMVSLIEKLKEEKRTDLPHTRLSMVVCNRNYQDIVKFVELCQKTGVKDALIKKMIPPSKEIAEELELTDEQKNEMKEYLFEALKTGKKYNVNVSIEWPEWMEPKENQAKREDTPCYYGWLFSMIDGNGNVYPCCFQNRGPSCTMGNVTKDNFSMIWFSKRYQDFRRNHKNIKERRQMGYQCDESSCFFNNQQILEILHKPYLLPIIYRT